MNSFPNDGNFHTYTHMFGQNPDGIFKPDLIKWIKVYINYGVFGRKGNGQIEIESIKFKSTATYLHEYKLNKDIKVWPNPFHDNIQIHSSKSLAGIEIFDVSGKLVLSKPVNNLHTVTINLDGTPSASFLRAIFNNGTSKNVLLIKNR